MSSLRSSDVLTPRQLAFIAERLPEPPCALRGRRPYSNLQLLPGILRVLRSGCRWRDLDRPGFPSGVTHWRRLRYWHRRTGYRRVWHSLLNFLVQGKRLDRSLVSLDGTLIPNQEFAEQTGYSGKNRAVGTKLSLLVDRAGTPLAVSVAPDNYHDGALEFLTLTTIYKPPPILRGILPDLAKTTEPTLLADKGYDSRRFRQFVQEHGFRPLIPTRSCIPSEQAVGELYSEDAALQRKRYVVERTVSWLKGFRRLRYRVDRTAASFHAFVYLAVLVLCVRRLMRPSQVDAPARSRRFGHTDAVSEGHALLTSRRCTVCCDYLRQLHIRCTAASWSLAPRCRTRRFRPERITPRAGVPRVPSGQQLGFVKEHE